MAQRQSALKQDASTFPDLKTRPLSPHIGLEILGIDLDQDLDPKIMAQIKAAWTHAGVLLFRDSGHSIEAQMRLSHCFGELQPSANKELNLGSNPYLLNLAYDPESTRAWTATLYEVGGKVRAGWLERFPFIAVHIRMN